MALTAQIEPVFIFSETGTTLCCDITQYDLLGVNCQAQWWLLDDNGYRIHWETIFIPQDRIINWGTDDSIIIQAIADIKGFVIIP
jgi:hypothetical protein